LKKRLYQLFALALCLCLLLPMSAAATGELLDLTNRNECNGPPPEPEKESQFVITIAAPRGWFRRAATVTIRLDDVNKTGFAKAEAKFGSNGSWQDISDSLRAHGWAHVEISDNGTVYVSVTDKKGKAHVRSLYIECFDREAPTVRARIEGQTLRVEADDAHSGVEYIFVNGYRFDDHTNGMLDIRVRDYAEKDEEFIFVYAVDFAGNRSRTVQVKNPHYVQPSSSKPETSPQETAKTETTAPIPATTEPASQAPTATPPPAAASTPQAAMPSTQGEQQPAPGDDSVTPTDGSGTVIENSVKTPDQREFFTINTDAGNTFYIVVDKQKTDRNVYLMSEVTEDDLMGLATKSDTVNTPEPVPPVPEPMPLVPEPELEQTPPDDEQPEPETKKKNDNGTIAIVVIFVLAIGGVGYYVKIIRPKRDIYYDEDEDEDEDEEMPDSPESGEDESEDGIEFEAPESDSEEQE